MTDISAIGRPAAQTRHPSPTVTPTTEFAPEPMQWGPSLAMDKRPDVLWNPCIRSLLSPTKPECQPGAGLAYGKVSRHHLIPVIEPACGAAGEAALPAVMDR